MEDSYVISGGKPLKGEVKLSGAKNVALKIIIASLLIDGEVTLKNIPRINDVYELLRLIKELGGKADFVDKNTLVIDGRGINNNKVDLRYGNKIRVTFMLFAPLLHKFDHCYVPNPGGCRIGARPIDRIIEGMKNLGIKTVYDSHSGYYEAVTGGKSQGYYRFEKSSHTGTELMILISVLNKQGENGKKTVIDNAAQEPEIDELIRFLNESGAKISRKDGQIVVDSVNKLTRNDPFTISSDRNEAITFAVLAIATKGDIVVSGVHEYLIKTFIEELEKAGGGINILDDEKIRFYYKGILKPTNIVTSPHPGFMTDWQPNWAVLMTQADGQSTIIERVFENRFSYVDELKKLGAKIEYIKKSVDNPEDYFFFSYDPKKVYRQAIRITGPQNLHGGFLKIADLRAGATLAVAALVAQGRSIIKGVSILERGYEDFDKKISSLGGEIKKI